MAATVVGYSALLGGGDFRTAFWTAPGAQESWVQAVWLQPGLRDLGRSNESQEKNIEKIKNCQSKTGRRSMNFLANV